MPKPTVLLAFSGGLDTCFSIPWLIEQGYTVQTLTLDTGGFAKVELKQIAQRAQRLGSVKHHTLDVTGELYDSAVSWIIRANGRYQGVYPLMCIDRYLIAQKLSEVAKVEKCQAVATGNTGQGNDQVRIDLALSVLAPQLANLSPIRDTGIRREEEIAFLKQYNFAIPVAHKRYSKNENLLGITLSGSEIDRLEEPEESAFVLTKPRKTQPRRITLTFQNGLPVALDGKKIRGVDLLTQLNQLVGSYGIGRGRYVADCMIGIKGHLWFEAPGILALIAAHQALEQLVLTKPQRDFKQTLDTTWAQLAYDGRYYDPLAADLEAFMTQNQQVVSGEVTLRLQSNDMQVVALSSPHSLINRQIADYAQSASWSGTEARGFTKLYGLQTAIAAGRKKKGKS